MWTNIRVASPCFIDDRAARTVTVLIEQFSGKGGLPVMGSRSTVGAPSLSKFATPAAESKRNLAAPGDCQRHHWKRSQRTHTHLRDQ